MEKEQKEKAAEEVAAVLNTTREDLIAMGFDADKFQELH